MSVQLLKSTETSSGPIGADELKAILADEIANANDPKEKARLIAQRLITKSSKHKFLVSVTEIDSEPDADLGIESVIGAVWDDQKDGYCSFRVDDTSIHLITVYWIHVD